MILALTSDTITQPQMYDAADSILAQKLAQIEGVGQVIVGGGARPRSALKSIPLLLNKLGVGLDRVRTALAAANANQPKGQLRTTTTCLGDRCQRSAVQGRQNISRSIVAYRNGAPVRLRDVADV